MADPILVLTLICIHVVYPYVMLQLKRNIEKKLEIKWLSKMKVEEKWLYAWKPFCLCPLLHFIQVEIEYWIGHFQYLRIVSILKNSADKTNKLLFSILKLIEGLHHTIYNCLLVVCCMSHSILSNIYMILACNFILSKKYHKMKQQLLINHDI